MFFHLVIYSCSLLPITPTLKDNFVTAIASSPVGLALFGCCYLMFLLVFILSLCGLTYMVAHVVDYIF